MGTWISVGLSLPTLAHGPAPQVVSKTNPIYHSSSCGPARIGRFYFRLVVYFSKLYRLIFFHCGTIKDSMRFPVIYVTTARKLIEINKPAMRWRSSRDGERVCMEIRKLTERDSIVYFKLIKLLVKLINVYVLIHTVNTPLLVDIEHRIPTYSDHPRVCVARY